MKRWAFYDDYASPEQVARRNRSGESVCVDEGCGLSGGFAHVGPCEPCACGKEHAVAECPARAVTSLACSHPSPKPSS